MLWGDVLAHRCARPAERRGAHGSDGLMPFAFDEWAVLRRVVQHANLPPGSAE